MVFIAKKNTYGYHVDVNQALINGYNAWKSGCVVSTIPASMTLNISPGILQFQEGESTTSADTVIIAPSDPVLGRRDLIAYNGTDFVVLQGTPADESLTTAQPPDYDINAYVIIAMVHIVAGVTYVDPTEVTDYRTRAIVGSNASGTLDENFMYLGY
jgi:hypothetical protein